MVDPRLSAMDPRDVFALFTNRLATVEILGRTVMKARQGGELRRWGDTRLARSGRIDPRSSLANDDAGFMADYGGDMVSVTALFPAMSATDALAAIAELIEWRPKSGSSHGAAVLALCRTAIESAATTIWLLSSTDQAMRRGLSARFTNSELREQLRYHQSTNKWFEADPERKERQDFQSFQEHVRLYHERVEMLRRGESTTPKANVLSNGAVVAAAAQWLDKHPPRHARDVPGPYGEKYGFKDVADSFYTTSSAIIHGLKWPLDYMPSGEVDLSRMIVEGVNVAVAMGECAVALFESQASQRGPRSNRQRLYPARLIPTVKEWSMLYPVHPRIHPDCLRLGGLRPRVDV
jgi:hypothetical protein